MKFVPPATMLALLLVAPAAAPSQPVRDDGPELSDAGWCVVFYNAFTRARERRSRTPKRLHESAGFFSIDFATRAAAVRAKLTGKEDFAISYHQQPIEQAFDLAADADADGKPPAENISMAVAAALIQVRKCDTAHGFTPALLDRLATQPSPPVEPYSCAVNYFALGMGMKADSNAQRAAMQRIGASMARFDATIGGDSAWRDIVRARIQADAADRNKAVSAGTVKPQDLFAHSQACDRLLATPG
jgi:hypothetical protein